MISRFMSTTSGSKLRVPLPAKSNPRALVVRLGAMGDVLHALPAVAMLRRALPEARIGWVVEQRWRELLCAPEVELAGSRGAGRPLVDEVHLVDTRAWRKRLLGPETRREFLAAIQGMQARQYDAALDLQGAIKSAVVAKLSGASTTLGFRKPRERLARWLYDSLADGRAPHVIEQNLELVQTWLEEIGLSRATSTLNPGTALLPRDKASEARIEATLQSKGLARVAHRDSQSRCGLGRQTVGAGALRRARCPARLTRSAPGHQLRSRRREPRA